MFVAVSRFVVANDKAGEVDAAFRSRPGLVDSTPGFVRMDVIRGRESPGEFRLITFWTDEGSYRAWHRSHAYRESHARIPGGLKLVRGSVRIEYFDHVTD